MPRAEAVPLQEILLHVNVSDGLNDSVTADAGDLAAGGPTPSPDELEDDGELTITRSLSRTSITEEHSEYQLPRVVSWMNGPIPEYSRRRFDAAFQGHDSGARLGQCPFLWRHVHVT